MGAGKVLLGMMAGARQQLVLCRLENSGIEIAQRHAGFELLWSLAGLSNNFEHMTRGRRRNCQCRFRGLELDVGGWGEQTTE
jgi:hypothetical protein